LQTVIEGHTDKLCKKPRDHIYGFVGLANDCDDGFPMDYRKPLYEVWKDAMAFKGSRKNRSQHDIMHFGKVVYNLLGGSVIDPVEGAEGDDIFCTLKAERVQEKLEADSGPTLGLNPTKDTHGSEPILNSVPTKSTINIPGQMTSRIIHLGPPYQETISTYK
jgi:hypothetical protein